MGIRPGERVLELGPGPGAFTVEAARRAGPAGRLIAVDVQPRMIAHVEARVRRAGLTNVETHVAGAHDLPLPDEDLNGTDEGVVHVLFGSAAGLTGAGSQLWSQDDAGDPDGAESNDRFGFRLTAGDLNCDGYADLAVGSPYEDVGAGGVVDAGAVTVLYGSGAGPVVDGSQHLVQGMSNITGALEAGDGFGFALAVGDFDGDGCGDLVVGVPYEEIGSPSITDAGVVHVLPGARAGLLTEPDQVWHQDKTDVEGEAQDGDLFGYAVAAIPRTLHVRLFLPLVIR